jgi:hypothetical protein
LDLEQLLLEQTQSFFLAIVKGQTQHKGAFEKKEHGPARLQLYSMQ